MKHIVILGAGVMGTAVAWPLSDNGHRISVVGTPLDRDEIVSIQEKGRHPRLFDPIPENVSAYQIEDLERVLGDADLLVSGVSSFGVDWMGETLAGALKRGMRVIGITKGFRATPAGDLQVFPRFLASSVSPAVRDASSFMAIGGPCIAAELAARRPSCVVFAAEDRAVAEETATLFRTPYYHVWSSDDVTGLELAVALKNGYVLGVGIATGMLNVLEGKENEELGDRPRSYNTAAAAYAQGLYEMEQLLVALGGNPAYAHSLPGAGDQFVTAMGGRSVRLGTLLGRGLSYAEAKEKMAGETLEAAAVVSSVAPVYRRLLSDGCLRDTKLPLLETLISVIDEGGEAKLPFEEFFQSIG